MEKNFNTQDDLKSNFIHHIEKIGSLGLLISTDQGVNLLNGDGITSVYPEMDTMVVYHKTEGFFATSYGLIIGGKKDSTYLTYSSFKYDQFAIHQVINDDEALWCASERGILYINSEKSIFRTDLNKVHNNNFTSILKRSNGELWCGSFGGGVSVINEKGILNRYSKSNGLMSYKVTCLFEDSNGNIWVGSSGQGVSKYDGESFTQITVENGLANNNVNTIFEDSDGDIWFGTSNGISKFEGEKYILFEKSSFLKGAGAYSFLQEEDSTFWISPFYGGVIRVSNNQKEVFNRKNGFTDKRVKCLFKDSHGTTWLGTDGAGVWKYEKNKFKRTRLTNQWVRGITQTSNGSICLATLGEGAAVLDGGKVTWIAEEKGLNSLRVNQLLYDSSGLWLLTDKGISVYENDTVINIDSLPHFRYLTGAKGTNRSLYFGSIGGGIVRYKNNKFSLFKDDQLDSDNIYALYSDKNELWVGTEKGATNIVFNQYDGVDTIIRHGQKEGFLGLEIIRNSIYKDLEGNFWFGTVNGATRYSPFLEVNTVKEVKPSITNVELFYSPLFSESLLGSTSLVKDSVFEYNQNHFTFRLRGVSLDKPHQIVYRWRLQGLDDLWSPANKQDFVTYSSLTPGKYIFEVQAKNQEGEWSREVNYPFVIKEPFWDTTIFRVLLYLFIGALFSVVFYLLYNRLKNKVKANQEKLLYELRMVELEQQALRLQMNPHFLFNCLNSIKGAIAQNDRKEAKTGLDRFAKLMRGMLENTRGGYVTLSKELDTLEQYMGLEQLNQDFEYKLIVEEEVLLEECQVPAMMLQPVVENAIVHGISPLTIRGEIVIKLRMVTGKIIKCEVIDNGIGLTQSQANKEKSVHQYESKGMDIIQSRLRLLSTQVPLVGFSLTDRNDGVRGTKAELILPVSMI